MQKIKAGIVGGAGYTGGELIRLLVHHPHVTIDFVHSKSSAGKPLSHVHADLIGDTNLCFTADLHNDIDVLFLCVGHGEAKKFLAENDIAHSVKVIDLSQDFRLRGLTDVAENESAAGREFVYGLPELNRNKIRSAYNIANPGCFATGIQLGLLPLAKAGLVENVYTTGITGSTGAGQSLTATSHFSWRANNVQAYKTLSHQHVNEIHESIHQLQSSFPSSPAGNNGKMGLNFIPWRGDFTRGIFISSQIDCEMPQQELIDLYEDYYQDHPFTWVSREPIFLKQVVNTNKCVIQLEKVGTKLVVHSAIDNLLKGASGQAVQNMNLLFGLDECAGLNLKANFF
ncbi:MAG TPA: N-acetyl-gamma-glutamyl-phosphate reductase [Chitinophagaceae bacterium]|nr:N-acetyl-gamma-glutamyl-phosphate reductase [Chitinophagaceae bacterium]